MTKKTIIISAILISILFGIFGFAAVLQSKWFVFQYLHIPASEAIKWFGFSFIAFLSPRLSEISFSGYGIKLWDAVNQIKDEVKQTRNEIENLELVINSQKKASREYLIKSFYEYCKYLESLHKDNVVLEKVVELNEIYFKELGIEIKAVKKALNNWISQKRNNKSEAIADMSNTITLELVNTLKLFQQENDLEYKDGIYGYYTCEKLRAYMDQAKSD